MVMSTLVIRGHSINGPLHQLTTCPRFLGVAIVGECGNDRVVLLDLHQMVLGVILHIVNVAADDMLCLVATFSKPGGD